MGKLEAEFKIRLSFPLLAHAVNQPPAVVKFTDTNNSVSIEFPKSGPAPENPALGTRGQTGRFLIFVSQDSLGSQ